MKIVVCNYRYFVSGGPERYMFSLMELLGKKGHDVLPFSVAYSLNQESAYSHYFVDPPGHPDQVYFREMNLSPYRKMKAAINAIYSINAKRKLEKMIYEQKPDIIQTLQIHTVLSYSLFDAAHKLGVPIICRLSNYQLMCPAEHFLRDYRVCEKCHKSLLYGIRYKCVQNSLPASAIRVFSLYFNRMKNTFSHVNRFIVPSYFLKQKMIEYGYPEERVVRVPTFVPVKNFTPSYDYNDYIVYVGRIAIEKGVHHLLRAFSKIKSNTKLVVIGRRDSPEAERVFQETQDCDYHNVEFMGYQSLEKIKEIVKRAMFTVCPAIWYENNPNSIYESFAMGKPVIGSNLGSIREQVVDGERGLLFEPGSTDDLAEKITKLIKNPAMVRRMGKSAREYVVTEHSPEVHYQILKQIYDDVFYAH